jgi:4-coumarate--CoA ligase
MHPVVGHEPFAVLGSYNGKTQEQVKEHVRSVFGKDYALGGLASLKELGLLEFPVNQTHKIVKSKVQEDVERHLSRLSAMKA